MAGPADAQKHHSNHAFGEPHRDHKVGKTGFVGSNPNHKYKSGHIGFVGKDPSTKRKKSHVGFVGLDPTMDRPKIKYMKPSAGKPLKSNLYVPQAKIKPPKGRVKFMAADNINHTADIKTPKIVTDKQMVLPKMRGDRKTKMPKTEYIGINPNLGANVVKEKHNSDIQYKTAYKFGKKGGLDKTSRKH